MKRFCGLLVLVAVFASCAGEPVDKVSYEERMGHPEGDQLIRSWIVPLICGGLEQWRWSAGSSADDC